MNCSNLNKKTWITYIKHKDVTDIFDQIRKINNIMPRDPQGNPQAEVVGLGCTGVFLLYLN